jgi:hypothetical protein
MQDLIKNSITLPLPFKLFILFALLLLIISLIVIYKNPTNSKQSFISFFVLLVSSVLLISSYGFYKFEENKLVNNKNLYDLTRYGSNIFLNSNSLLLKKDKYPIESEDNNFIYIRRYGKKYGIEKELFIYYSR